MTEEPKPWTKKWGFHYRSYQQRHPEWWAWESPLMRETCSCDKEGLRGSCSTQGLHVGEAKPRIQRDQDCRPATASRTEAGAALPTQRGRWQVAAPLAGPFLEEQDLLYLQPKAFQAHTRECFCCSAWVKEDTWRHEVFHQLQQDRSPLPVVAGNEAHATRGPDPGPWDGRRQALVPLSIELLGRSSRTPKGIG